MTCFLCSSLSRLLLYSSWFSSSVWCCSRIRSMRSFCNVCSCLYSSSRVDSSCRISMACSISFCVLFLFSSCIQEEKIHGERWMETNWREGTTWWGKARNGTINCLLIKPVSVWQHDLMRLDEQSLETEVLYVDPSLSSGELHSHHNYSTRKMGLLLFYLTPSYLTGLLWILIRWCVMHGSK